MRDGSFLFLGVCFDFNRDLDFMRKSSWFIDFYGKNAFFFEKKKQKNNILGYIEKLDHDILKVTIHLITF